MNAEIFDDGRRVFYCHHRSKIFQTLFGDRTKLLERIDSYPPIIEPEAEAFIGALISGDGFVDIGDRCVGICNTNLNLLFLAKTLLEDFYGVKGLALYPYSTTKTGKMAYVLRLGVEPTLELYSTVGRGVMQRGKILWRTAIHLRDKYSYKDRERIRSQYSKLLSQLLQPLPKIEGLEETIAENFSNDPANFINPVGMLP